MDITFLGLEDAALVASLRCGALVQQLSCSITATSPLMQHT